MRKWTLLAIVATASAPCFADAVSELNDAAIKIAAPPGSNLAINTLALTNLAMFDAANAIERRYAPYRAVASPVPSGVQAEPAALAAGCAALAAAQPAQKAAVTAACEVIAQRLPAGTFNEAARRFGESIGNDLVASRAESGLTAPNRYRPFTTAGTYVPTALPIGWEVATTRPMAMTSPSQFRPGAPPILTNDTWTRDYNEVRSLGARASSTRTPEQTATAQFYSPPGYTQLVESMAENPPAAPSIAGRARGYALVYLALFDVGIAVFDTKYAYHFWRPITAIRNGDLDANASTEPDVGWTPLLETPPHPEYPCAHCATSTALGTVLAAVVEPGRRIAIRGANNGRREFATPADLSADVVNARIYSGVHYRNSGETAVALGKRVAEYILATQLRPLP